MQLICYCIYCHVLYAYLFLDEHFELYVVKTIVSTDSLKTYRGGRIEFNISSVCDRAPDLESTGGKPLPLPPVETSVGLLYFTRLFIVESEKRIQNKIKFECQIIDKINSERFGDTVV